MPLEQLILQCSCGRLFALDAIDYPVGVYRGGCLSCENGFEIKDLQLEAEEENRLEVDGQR